MPTPPGVVHGLPLEIQDSQRFDFFRFLTSHIGGLEAGRRPAPAAAYNRIVAFITHYNEKLCTDIDSDSEGDDE